MKARIITAVVALLFGILGVGLSVLAQHLYQDHQMLHALIQIEAQRQQAAKPAAPAQ